MLKKELHDTLRILLESAVLLLSVPIIIIISLIMGFKVHYVQLLKVTSIITIFAFAGYSGLGMFLWEKRDKGFEYLLALPMSRLKIFVYKLLPRVVVLLLLTGISILILNMSENAFPALIFIQLGAVFLSLALNSYFTSFIVIILLGFLYSLSSRFITGVFHHWKGYSFDPFAIISPHVLAALLLGIPLAIAFFLALKNFDLKPYKYVIKPYLFIALPLLLVQAAVIFLFYETAVYF